MVGHSVEKTQVSQAPKCGQGYFYARRRCGKNEVTGTDSHTSQRWVCLEMATPRVSQICGFYAMSILTVPISPWADTDSART